MHSAGQSNASGRSWLGALAVFLAVARAKSFARAAASLGLSSSTVSRRIADLETALGLRLLNRTTRRVELTEEGYALFISAERIDEEVRSIQEDLRDRKINPLGLLRVAMPESIATHLAVPWVAEFLEQYPAITMDIHTAPSFIDPVADQFDVCVHYHPVRDSSLTIRKLASFPRSLFASPSHIANHGAPARPEDLASHRCVCLGSPGAGQSLWRLTRGAERVSVEVSGRIFSASLDLGHAFAMKGVGIAAVVGAAYRGDIAGAKLVPILPEWQFEPLTVSAILPTKLIPAKTRFFSGVLRDENGRCQSTPR